MASEEPKPLIVYFHEFCSSTGIRGFSYFRNSLCVWEKLLWTTAIIVGTYVTLSDVVLTVSRYLHNDTYMIVSLINTKLMNLGTPTLCIELDISTFSTGTLSIQSLPDVEKFISELPKDFDLLKFMTEEADKDYPSGVLLENDSNLTIDYASERTFHETNPLSRPILTLTLMVLSSLIRYENLLESTEFTWEPFNFKETEEQPRNASIYAFYQYMLTSKVDFIMATKVAAYLLCRKMSLRVRTVRFEEQYGRMVTRINSICSIEAITWLGFPPLVPPASEYLCVNVSHLAPNFAGFGSSIERSWLSINAKPLYSRLDDNFKSLWANIHFDGGPVLTDLAQNVLSIPLKRKITATVVQNLGLYDMLKSGKGQCSETNILPAACKIRCRIEYIKANCLCNPISEPRAIQTPSLKTCGINSSLTNFQISQNPTEKCLQFRKVDSPNPECSDNCRKRCQLGLLGFYTTNEPNVYDNSTLVRLKVDLFVYANFKEVPLMTPKQLLGCLGGNLNFLLGMNFLILLHAFVYPIRVFIDRRKPKRMAQE